MVQIGQQGGKHPQRQIALEFALATLAQPGRNDGRQQIHADEHVDIPEVAHLDSVVERDAAHAGDAGGDAVAATQHEVDGIGHAPEHPREEDAGEAAAEEGGGRGGDGQQQIARNHHKKRYTDACHAVHPCQQRDVGMDDAQVVSDVVILAGVLPQHQHDGDHSDEVERHIARRFAGRGHYCVLLSLLRGCRQSHPSRQRLQP